MDFAEWIMKYPNKTYDDWYKLQEAGLAGIDNPFAEYMTPLVSSNPTTKALGIPQSGMLTPATSIYFNSPNYTASKALTPDEKAILTGNTLTGNNLTGYSDYAIMQDESVLPTDDGTDSFSWDPNEWFAEDGALGFMGTKGFENAMGLAGSLYGIYNNLWGNKADLFDQQMALLKQEYDNNEWIRDNYETYSKNLGTGLASAFGGGTSTAPTQTPTQPK